MDDLYRPMTDEEIVAQCVHTFPGSIVTFKSRYVTPELWEHAISEKPELFPQCKDKTFHLALLALSRDGLLCKYVDPVRYTGSQYEQLCKIAIDQNTKAFLMIPKELRSASLSAYAYAKDTDLMVGQKALTHDMVKAMITNKPSLIRDVVDPSDEMIIAALSKDPRTIVYFKTISPRVRAFFEESFPQHAAMLVHD